MEDRDEVEYMSFNGLSRNAMVYGVPYMAALTIGSTSALLTMVALIAFGPPGLLVFLLAVPMFIFIRFICETDDRAIDIFLLEAKWSLIKMSSGLSKYFGGTLTFSPITYGRKRADVKRYFEATYFE